MVCQCFFPFLPGSLAAAFGCEVLRLNMSPVERCGAQGWGLEADGGLPGGLLGPRCSRIYQEGKGRGSLA